VKVVHLQCADLAKMVERLRRRALKENRFDDANDDVIRKRLMVYDVETKPVLEYYPPETIARVDATMSQIRVLSKIIEFLVPLKEDLDHQSHAHLEGGDKVGVKADSAAATMAMAGSSRQ
jgi:adenylate kinase